MVLLTFAVLPLALIAGLVDAHMTRTRTMTRHHKSKTSSTFTPTTVTVTSTTTANCSPTVILLADRDDAMRTMTRTRTMTRHHKTKTSTSSIPSTVTVTSVVTVPCTPSSTPPPTTTTTSSAPPTTTTTSTTPTPTPSQGPTVFLGCYHDCVGPDFRALVGPYYQRNQSNTVEGCAGFCNGYQYFGVEYSAECYCSDTISSYTSPYPGACTDPCAGDSSELCGNFCAIDIYSQ